jgi:hypothetical protein
LPDTLQALVETQAGAEVFEKALAKLCLEFSGFSLCARSNHFVYAEASRDLVF